VYNIRYHIASLVAVFLALALGLVLGGIVGQSGVITQQRSALVQGLRDDFKKLSEENKTLKGDLGAQEQLSQALLARETAGRLNGRAVLLLANSGQTQGLQAAEQAIRDAGGAPVVVTLAKPGLGLDDKDVAAALAGVIDTQTPTLDGVAALLAQELSTAHSTRRVLQALQGARVLSLSATATDTPISSAVVLAAFDGEPDAGALAIGRALAESALPVVAGEEPGSKLGLAAQGVDDGLSALDTLGTLVGRYTLVQLLDGSAKGYYGTGLGATAVYPRLP
jgi:hypothetical protein